MFPNKMLKKLLKSKFQAMFKTSEFTKHVITIATGTGLAQLIMIALSPVLTRLYSPANFGIYALFVSFSSILAIFTTGKYEYSILVADKDEDAWSCVVLITKIAVVGSLLIMLISGVIYFFRGGKFGSLSCPLWFIPLLGMSLVLNGLFQAFYFWFNRFNRYSELAKNQIYGSVGVALVSIMLGFTKIKYGGLILGLITGQIINTGLLFINIRNAKKKFSIGWENLKEQALKYKNYPKFLIMSGLLDRSSAQLHIILFSFMFSSVVTGYLGLYQKVIRVPVNLIGTSVANVFRQRASLDLNSSGQCKSLFVRTALKLFLIGTFPFLILLFFSPSLFEIVFGKQWRIAGEYAQIMSWMFWLGFVVSPLSSLIYVGQKQKYDLMLQIFLIISTSISILIGWHFKSVTMALILYTVSYCMKYLIEFIISYKIAVNR